MNGFILEVWAKGVKNSSLNLRFVLLIECDGVDQSCEVCKFGSEAAVDEVLVEFETLFENIERVCLLWVRVRDETPILVVVLWVGFVVVVGVSVELNEGQALRRSLGLGSWNLEKYGMFS